MNKIFFLGSLLFSFAASAYTDGTYTCATNVPDLPRVVKIETVQIKDGLSLPYMEITRSFRKVPNDPNSGIETTQLKGFAAHSTAGGREMLVLAAMRVDFQDGQIQNCKQ
ncbi:MAG TPA: hypothetical protein PL182_09630 [Pseudobdellovibrionaceae bacterium]|nr:hypothetical protein [Pseudobdellovibrionaceae bacterium]